MGEKVLKNIALLIAFILLFSGFGSATFGVSPFDTEAEVNNSRAFEIGLINTGEKTLKLNFSFENVSGSSVNPESDRVFLKPSARKSSPEGGGWYYLNGEYVKIRYWSFEYTANSVQGEDSFELNIQATPRNSSGPVYGPKVAQLREIQYNVDVIGDNSYGGITWTQDQKEEDQTSQTPESKTNPPTENNQENSTVTNISGDSPESGEQNEESSVNSLTLLLLVITLFTLGYILYEV